MMVGCHFCPTLTEGFFSREDDNCFHQNVLDVPDLNVIRAEVFRDVSAHWHRDAEAFERAFRNQGIHESLLPVPVWKERVLNLNSQVLLRL